MAIRKSLALMTHLISNIFSGPKGTKASLGGSETKFHGGQNFQAWWTMLKGAPGRTHPGMTELPQWQWPDKEKYGQAKDGSIRRREPKIPFRVRRWRKRAAASIVKQQGHTLSYAKDLVKSMEADIVRKIVKKAG